MCTKHLTVCPVFLCGGSGKRLWPISTEDYPKQFVPLFGGKSLLQHAYERLAFIRDRLGNVSAPILVANERHRFVLTQHLEHFSEDRHRILLEPFGRNTAPALTLAALEATLDDSDCILIVMPSDQMVKNPERFAAVIEKAVSRAAEGEIIALGVNPTRPAIGYGYLSVSPNPMRQEDSADILVVESFIEKPNKSTAQSLIDSGEVYWNSGIYVARASVWLNALNSFRPDILDLTKNSWLQRVRDFHSGYIRPGADEFDVVPSESIDYAVMERCPGSEFSMRMLVLDAGWSDLGEWEALWDFSRADDAGNSVIGNAVISGSHNSAVVATSRAVGLFGVKDLAILETPDHVLVAEKQSLDTRAIQMMNDRMGSVIGSMGNRRTHRLWGWFDVILDEGKLKVKRLHLNPSASISLQKHFHRNEHWFVTSGRAKVICDGEVSILEEGGSISIGVEQVHQLTNLLEVPLEIIEVQTGGYLGEDDIVRFESN